MKARLAKRKPGFWERTKESWKSMKLWDAEELNKLDWVISAVILMFLFFTCAYGDLMLTGNRSFLMYEHFTDFYKASYEQSHELCPEVCAGGDPVGRPDFGEKPEHKEVRQVGEHIFSNLVTQRPSFTASLVRCFSFACVLICSVNFRSWPRMEALSCSLFSTFALYFWKAAVMASA